MLSFLPREETAEFDRLEKKMVEQTMQLMGKKREKLGADLHNQWGVRERK